MLLLYWHIPKAGVDLGIFVCPGLHRRGTYICIVPNALKKIRPFQENLGWECSHTGLNYLVRAFRLYSVMQLWSPCQGFEH